MLNVKRTRLCQPTDKRPSLACLKCLSHSDKRWFPIQPVISVVEASFSLLERTSCRLPKWIWRWSNTRQLDYLWRWAPEQSSLCHAFRGCDTCALDLVFICPDLERNDPSIARRCAQAQLERLLFRGKAMSYVVNEVEHRCSSCLRASHRSPSERIPLQACCHRQFIVHRGSLSRLWCVRDTRSRRTISYRSDVCQIRRTLLSRRLQVAAASSRVESVQHDLHRAWVWTR